MKAVLILVLLCITHSLGTKQGRYAFLTNDNCSPGAALLTLSLHLQANDKVLLQSDGRYYPKSSCLGNVYISMNGTRVSNNVPIAWRSSKVPVQHSYNTIGFETITADGIYEFSLQAEYVDGPYCVGAGSNLIVFVNPASSIYKQVLQQDTGTFTFQTPTKQGIPVPHTPVVTITNIDPAQPVIALASSYVYLSGREGDAMMGLYFDGKHLGNNASMWTVNDMFHMAEVTAPLYTHGFVKGVKNVSYEASTLPWDFAPDVVEYKVGATSRLITLQGGMQVYGSAFTSSNVDHWWDWECVGSNSSWPGCPPADSSGKAIAESTVEIPQGHPGLLMIIAKTRVQGDDKDIGGIATIRIELDGKVVGSTGVQQLQHPDCVSSRTVSASYLATDLQPGKHTIRAVGAAQGSFIHLANCKDLPLIWFD